MVYCPLLAWQYAFDTRSLLVIFRVLFLLSSAMFVEYYIIHELLRQASAGQCVLLS